MAHLCYPTYERGFGTVLDIVSCITKPLFRLNVRFVVVGRWSLLLVLPPPASVTIDRNVLIEKSLIIENAIFERNDFGIAHGESGASERHSRKVVVFV